MAQHVDDSIVTWTTVQLKLDVSLQHAGVGDTVTDNLLPAGTVVRVYHTIGDNLICGSNLEFITSTDPDEGTPSPCPKDGLDWWFIEGAPQGGSWGFITGPSNDDMSALTRSGWLSTANLDAAVSAVIPDNVTDPVKTAPVSKSSGGIILGLLALGGLLLAAKERK